MLEQIRPVSFIDDEERQASALADHLSLLADAHDKNQLIAAPNLEALSWPKLGPKYTAIFERLLSRSVSG